MLQDMASWSRDGIAGLQSVVLYSLPELDGAIDTVPLGGLVGDNIFLVSERVTRLSQRIKKWVHLRRSETQVSTSCLCFAALPCSALPCPALYVCLLRFSALPCLTLPCPALLCPALPCPALPCSALLCPALSTVMSKFLSSKVLVTGSVQSFNIAVWLPTRASVLDISINEYSCENTQSSAIYLPQKCHLQDPKIAILLCGAF